MIFLGLGSNLGDRAKTIREAIARLRPYVGVDRVSAFFESRAMLPPGAPSEWDSPYLNVALSGTTVLSPWELLHKIKNIEKSLGRGARGRWAPREIDIDILAWDGQALEELELQVPHPGLAERPFALLPLLQIAPDWRFPSSIADSAFAGKLAAEVASRWRAGPMPFETRSIGLCAPELVGILNLTPDSFSDGGMLDGAEAALTRALSLVEHGATVLDLGAESTRPGATPISASEEWKRLEPTLRLLREEKITSRARISVDTRHAEVAERALELGANWINDVSGLSDPRLLKGARHAGAEVVVMHSLSVPADPKKVLDGQLDPVRAVREWFARKLESLESLGFSREKIIFDPGIGFGKTAAQSLALLKAAKELRMPGTRLLVGHSRKSFLSSFTSAAFSERDLETVTASLVLAGSGVDYLRVHNIEAHMRAFRVSAALW